MRVAGSPSALCCAVLPYNSAQPPSRFTASLCHRRIYHCQLGQSGHSYLTRPDHASSRLVHCPGSARNAPTRGICPQTSHPRLLGSKYALALYQTGKGRGEMVLATDRLSTPGPDCCPAVRERESASSDIVLCTGKPEPIKVIVTFSRSRKALGKLMLDPKSLDSRYHCLVPPPSSLSSSLF